MRHAKLASVGATVALFALPLVGCKQRNGVDPSAVKVTNGIETTDDPSVVMLVNEQTAAMCTGTFVSPTILLTASHCLGAAANGNLIFGEMAAAAAFYVGAVGDGAALKPTDLAVVGFADAVAPATSALARVSPQPGTFARLVGFGRKDASDSASSGRKRYGTNHIEKIADGFLYLSGVATTSVDTAPGERAASAKGDSGGPLLVDGDLVGVDSGGGLDPDGKKHSIYVNLSSLGSCKLLHAAVDAGADIPSFANSACAKR